MEEMQQQINTLYEFMETLMNNTTLPREVVEGMRIRLIKNSGKKATDANVTTVLSSTPGGVRVANAPQGFIKLQDGKNIPFYYD